MAFKATYSSSGIDISFSATLKNIDRAAGETERYLNKAGLKDQCFDVILVMREALINAVRHGCSGDFHKMIKFNLSLDSSCIIMEVEDEGSGFDWRDCLKKDVLSLEDCGRGMSIMKKYFTEVGYNKKGNKLILLKMF